MTENEIVKQAIRCIVGACDETCKGYDAKKSVCHGYEEVASGLETILKEYESYRAIGTVEEIPVLFKENHKAGYDAGYAKGIDDFVEKFIYKAVCEGCSGCCGCYEEGRQSECEDWKAYMKIADQLKGGV